MMTKFIDENTETGKRAIAIGEEAELAVIAMFKKRGFNVRRNLPSGTDTRPLPGYDIEIENGGQTRLVEIKSSSGKHTDGAPCSTAFLQTKKGSLTGTVQEDWCNTSIETHADLLVLFNHANGKAHLYNADKLRRFCKEWGWLERGMKDSGTTIGILLPWSCRDAGFIKTLETK
jgi:hypothetical protein